MKWWIAGQLILVRCYNDWVPTFSFDISGSLPMLYIHPDALDIAIRFIKWYQSFRLPAEMGMFASTRI